MQVVVVGPHGMARGMAMRVPSPFKSSWPTHVAYSRLWSPLLHAHTHGHQCWGGEAVPHCGPWEA